MLFKEGCFVWNHYTDKNDSSSLTILCLWQADIGERCNIKLYVFAICWVGEVHNLEETLPLLLSHASLHLWLSRRRKEVWRHDARVLHLTLTSVTLGSGKYTWISKSLIWSVCHWIGKNTSYSGWSQCCCLQRQGRCQWDRMRLDLQFIFCRGEKLACRQKLQKR